MKDERWPFKAAAIVSPEWKRERKRKGVILREGSLEINPFCQTLLNAFDISSVRATC